MNKLAFALLAALVTASAWWWFTARDETAVRPAIPTSAAAQDSKSSTKGARPSEDAPDAGSESRAEVGPRSTDLARIDVRVVTPDSTPVAAHTIVALEPSVESGWSGARATGSVAQPGECARTNERGEATLYVEPRKPLVVASLTARPAESRVLIDALDIAERRTVTLAVHIAPDRQVHGRVLDVLTRAPLPDAEVIGHAYGGPVLARSDRDGRFVAAVQSWRTESLIVTCAGFMPTEGNLEPGRGAADDPLVMLMARPAVIDLRVVDASGERVDAVVSARVDLASIAGDAAFLLQTEWSGEVDAGETQALAQRSPDVSVREKAKLPQLPAGVEIELEARSHLELSVVQRVVLSSGAAPHSVTLELPPAGTILGHVAGFPTAADLEVQLIHADKQAARVGASNAWIPNPAAWARTDSGGRFRIANVPAGDWKLSVEQPEGALALAAVRVNVAPGGGEYAVVLPAEAGAWLRGVVRMSDGAMEPTNISAERVDGLAVGEGWVSASGEFELGPLPGGEYVVRVGGWVDVASPHIRLFEAKLFRLAPAARVTTRLEPGVQELELELEPVRGVAVELVDTQDLPVLGTVVFATGGEAVAVSTGTSNIARFAMRTADRVLTVHAWSYDRRLTAERTFHIDGEHTDAPLRLVLAPQPLPPASKAPPRLTK